MIDRGMLALTRAVDFSERGGTRVPLVQVGPEDYSGMERPVLRKALDAVLLGKSPDLGLEDMNRSGALRLFLFVPKLVGFGGLAEGHKDLWDHTKRVVAQSEPKASVRWAALYHDVGKVQAFEKRDGKVTFHGHESISADAFRRLAEARQLFSAEEARHITGVIRELGRVESFEGEWTDSAVRRLDRELGPLLDDCVSLSRADITTARDSKRDAILRSIDDLVSRLDRTRREDAAPRLPKGLGDALHERLGVPKNAEMKRVMDVLQAALRRGDIPPDATVDLCVELARPVVADLGQA